MTSILRRAILAALLATLPLPAHAAEKLKVVASFSIIADFARNVGGERIELTTLVGPDSDAHVFEPRPADAAALAGADLVLVNGLHFEGFLTRLAEASGTKAPVVELSKGIAPRTMAEGKHEDEEHPDAGQDHDHGAVDPHAFQTVANARIYVGNVADAFCAADATGCDAYRANATAYLVTLDATEAELKTTLAAIPADRRTIITSHDAFGYFGEAYGIALLAPEGIATDAEPSAADVAALIRQIRDDRASAIFVENITDPRLIDRIAAETGLTVGGTLYSDALSGPEGPAATYVDMMLHNARTIRGAIMGS